MAERKTDVASQADPPGRAATSEEREHAAAARAVGQQLGPRQLGGTIIEADGRVTYTRDGAVSALPGGHPDPTIIPGQFPENDGGPVRVLGRADAAPLTGDAPGAEKP